MIIKKLINIKSVYILLLVLVISCNKTPNYNPFDNQFSISTKELIKNDCDTIFAGCGYINLQESSGKFRVFYQVHMDDFETVFGKGFIYAIDTFRIKKSIKLQYDILFDSLCNLPFSTEILEKEINKYNYSIFNQKDNVITLLNEDISDTIFLGIELEQRFNNNEMTVIRKLEYFNTK